MPFFKSMPEDARPPTVFNAHPEIYGPWSQMSQALMNGPSPLSLWLRQIRSSSCSQSRVTVMQTTQYRKRHNTTFFLRLNRP